MPWCRPVSRSGRASPAATGATTASRPADAVAYSEALKEDGIDFVDISSGGITADTRNPTEPGYNVPIAEQIKKEAGIATRVVGLILMPEQAEAIVADGKADMVAMARGFLNDPRWGWHAGAALGAEVPRVPINTCGSDRSCGRRPRSGRGRDPPPSFRDAA